MSPKRIIVFFGLVLACFLAVYAWDARTGRLSHLFSLSGLEIARQVLYPGIWIKDRAGEFAGNYLALTGVSEANAELTEKLSGARQALDQAREDQEELRRLRELLDLPAVLPWEKTGARVIAARFGPQAALNSVMLNKGFTGGATPGSPVVTPQGLVGRVYHTSPHSSTVLLVTDPSFRVAVIGQQSRVRGILSGSGVNKPLQVQYVAPNTNMLPGELLICSGIDAIMPKGLPAAQVETVVYDKNELFPRISARPLAQLARLEEVMVLIPPKGQQADELLYHPFREIDILPDLPDLDDVTDEDVAREMSGAAPAPVPAPVPTGGAAQ